MHRGWNRSFADHGERSVPGDSGASRVATSDRDKIPAERLLLRSRTNEFDPEPKFTGADGELQSRRSAGEDRRMIALPSRKQQAIRLQSRQGLS